MIRNCLVVSCLLVLECYSIAISKSVDAPIPFSGVYRPSLSQRPEDIDGAMLISKKRLVDTIVPLISTRNYKTRIGESAFEPILQDKCASCLTLMTRDYFDFLVEHLPSTITEMKATQRDAVKYLTKSLKKTARKLQHFATTSDVPDKRLNETVAVLVYNGDLNRKISSRMKQLFFEAAFWSVRRYYRSVVVMTKSEGDARTVQAMGLPIHTIYNFNVKLKRPKTTSASFSSIFSSSSSAAGARVQATLLRRALDQVALSLDADPDWVHFRYAYVMLGDQLLHLRRWGDIYNTLDSGEEGNFLMVPHRMQTLPVAQNFPPALQQSQWIGPYEQQQMQQRKATSTSAAMDANTIMMSSFDDTAAAPPAAAPAAAPAAIHGAQWLPHARIFTESLRHMTGSCCEAGRFLFPKCESSSSNTHSNAKSNAHFHSSSHPPAAAAAVVVPGDASWASCEEWGPRNFSTWLKIGSDGFTMPPLTVHQGYCTYSSTPTLCALPATARNNGVNGGGGSGAGSGGGGSGAGSGGGGGSGTTPMERGGGGRGGGGCTRNGYLDAAGASWYRVPVPVPQQMLTAGPQHSSGANIAEPEQYAYDHCGETPIVRINKYTLGLVERQKKEQEQLDELSLLLLQDSFSAADNVAAAATLASEGEGSGRSVSRKVAASNRDGSDGDAASDNDTADIVSVGAVVTYKGTDASPHMLSSSSSSSSGGGTSAGINTGSKVREEPAAAMGTDADAVASESSGSVNDSAGAGADGDTGAGSFSTSTSSSTSSSTSTSTSTSTSISTNTSTRLRRRVFD